MKKLIAMLLALLSLALPALAELPETTATAEPTPEVTPEPTPEPFIGDFAPRDGGSDQESLTVQVNGETVRLIYDNSPMYSSIQGGLVQASYYAYGADGDTMYLMYIIFPATANTGMVITPEYAAMTGEECSVVFIVSTSERERYYFSSVAEGLVYPTDSSFSIAIDGVEAGVAGTTYAGRLTASLRCLEAVDEAEAALVIPETPFRFTIGAGQAPRVEPGATVAPTDMRKV